MQGVSTWVWQWGLSQEGFHLAVHVRHNRGQGTILHLTAACVQSSVSGGADGFKSHVLKAVRDLPPRQGGEREGRLSGIAETTSHLRGSSISHSHREVSVKCCKASVRILPTLLVKRRLHVPRPRCARLGISLLKFQCWTGQACPGPRILIPHSLIQQIFVEHQLKARHWAGNGRKHGSVLSWTVSPRRG